VPAKNQAKLRAWGGSRSGPVGVDQLPAYQLVDATAADEVGAQLQPEEELKSYRYPLGEIGHIRDTVLETERELIERTVRSWMGQFAKHDDLVPVELAGGKVGAVALETTWTSEQRQAAAASIEEKVAKEKRGFPGGLGASWQNKSWEKDSAKAAELRAGGDGENIGARLLLPFGETKAQLVELVAESDLVNEYSSPGLSALATLVGSRREAPYMRILSDARTLAKQRKAAA